MGGGGEESHTSKIGQGEGGSEAESLPCKAGGVLGEKVDCAY